MQDENVDKAEQDSVSQVKNTDRTEQDSVSQVENADKTEQISAAQIENTDRTKQIYQQEADERKAQKRVREAAEKENSKAAAGTTHESYVIQPGEHTFSDLHGQVWKHRSYQSGLPAEWNISRRNHLSRTSNCITLENCAIIEDKIEQQMNDSLFVCSRANSN